MDAMDRGSELIAEIGNRIVADDAYAYIDWDALALVVEVTATRVVMHGFAYLDDGSIVPTLPDDLSLGDAFRELNALTARPDGKRWLAALTQIVRATAHVTVNFEWDDPDRWAVTPISLAAQREVLRPAE